MKPGDYFGNAKRWLIVKRSGAWYVCRPCSGPLLWIDDTVRGGVFDTGAEALAAFAAGNQRCTAIDRDGDRCSKQRNHEVFHATVDAAGAVCLTWGPTQ